MLSTKLLRSSLRLHRWYVAAAGLSQHVQQMEAPHDEQKEQQVEGLPDRMIKSPPPKISASEQFAAQLAECDTKQEAPEPVQRVVELEHVRSKIHELDQRKMRHQEYAQMLGQLVVKPTSLAPEQKLPFKQIEPIRGDMRQSLRCCSSVEEILTVTKDPQELANEVFMLLCELNAERRKNEMILESLCELKREKANKKSIDCS